MASTTGQRNIAPHRTLWNVSWAVGGGATVPSSTPAQIILSRTPRALTYCGAVGFDTADPDWTSEGLMGGAYADGMLAVYVTHPIWPADLVLTLPATPLTAGMTCAQLDAALAAGSQTPTGDSLDIGRGGRWYLFFGVDPAAVANGLIFSLGSGSTYYTEVSAGLGSIASGQPPVMMLFYDGGIRTVFNAGDPVRPDVSDLLDYLDGTIPAEMAVRLATIGHDEIDPSVPAADITELLRGAGEINLQAAVDPIEPWSTGTTPFGTLSLHSPSDVEGSNIIDTAQYQQIQGTPVTIELDIVRPDNATSLAVMAEIDALAGHTEQRNSDIDIELIAPVSRDLDSPPRRFWPGTIDNPGNDLGYEDESAAGVLYDLLLNVCPSTRWRDIIPRDWFWLMTRFGGTWGPVNISRAAMAEETTIRSVFDAMLATQCLCAGQDLDGRIAVWHPAAYRPSLRVHTLDPIEEYASGVRLQGLEQDQYAVIEIPYNTTISGTTTEYVDDYSGGASLASLARGRRLTWGGPLDYTQIDIGANTSSWTYAQMIRDSIGRQMTQRTVLPAVKLLFTIGLSGMTWRLGDQLVVTSALHGLTAKPFMITALNAAPMAAAVEVEAVHYAGWPGGHSLFQSTPPLGIYRWRRYQGWGTNVAADENPTLDNLSWGTDLTSDFSLGGPGDTWGTRQYGSWEGAGMYIEETGVWDGHLQTTAVTYAGCALPTAGGTQPNQVDVQVGYEAHTVMPIGGSAGTWDWLWRWWRTDTGEGLALLVKADPIVGGAYPDSLSLYLAHCTNCNPGIGSWGGANIIASLACPRGLSGNPTGYGLPHNVVSVSVAWDAEDSARLFNGQRLIGTLASTPDPTEINAFDIRTPQYATDHYVLNFFTRLIYNATAPTAADMLPDDGLDPLYR